MPVRAVCPECGETAVLSNGLPGDLVNCKQCGLEFPIPDAPKPPPLRKSKRPPPLMPPKPKVVGSEDPTPYASPGELDEPMLPPAGMSYGADEPELPPAKPKKKPRPAVNDERFELAPSSDRPSTPQSLPAFDDEPTIPTGKQSYGQDIRESDNAIPLAKGYGSHDDYDDDEPALPSSSRSFGQDLDDDPVIPLAKEGYGRDDDHAAIPLAKDGFGLHSYEDEEEEEKPLPPPKTPAFIPKLDDEPALPSEGNNYGRDLDDNEPELPALPPLPPPIPGGKRSNRRDVEDDEPAIPSSRKAYGRDEEEDRPTRRSSRDRRQFDDEGDDYDHRSKSKPSKKILFVAISLIGLMMLSAGGITAYLLYDKYTEEEKVTNVTIGPRSGPVPPFRTPNAAPPNPIPKSNPNPELLPPSTIDLPGKVDAVSVGGLDSICLKIKDNLYEARIWQNKSVRLDRPRKIPSNSIISAGAYNCVVFDRDSNQLANYSLNSREISAKKPSPFSQPIMAISEGISPLGIVLCIYGDEQESRIGFISELELMNLPFESDSPFPVLHGKIEVIPSAIGGVWLVREKGVPNARSFLVRFNMQGMASCHERKLNHQYLSLGTDGVTVCGDALYNGFDNVAEASSGPDWFFPASYGNTFLKLKSVSDLVNKGRQSVQMSIMTQGGDELLKLENLTVSLKTEDDILLQTSKPIFLTNNLELAAILNIDSDKNKLTVSMFGLDSITLANKQALTFTKSNPPTEFESGSAIFSNFLQVYSSGEYGLEIENPLPGMKISRNGVFEWNKPPKDTNAPVTIKILIKKDALQPLVTWTLYDAKNRYRKLDEIRLAKNNSTTPKVNPKVPLKKESEYAEGAKLVVKAPQTRPITPCTSDQAKWDVVTPGQIEDVCVAGGGRFLVLNCADVGKVAIFDTTQGKIVGTLPVKAENVLVAGSMDHVVVVYPDSNTVERWNLDKLEREAEGKFTSRQKVSTIVMGNAGAGPVILGGPQAQNNASKMSLMFLDLASLKEVRIDQVDGNHGVSFGSRAHLRASGDGSLLGAWYDALDPTGLQIVRLQGNSIHGEYVRDSVGYVHPASSRIYTSKGMYDLKGQPISKREAVIPAVQGEGYVTVTDIENGGKLISVFQGNDDKPTDAFDTLPGFDGRKDPFERDQAIRFWDKRLFLIPSAKILVGIPPQADRLRVVKLK
jgi:WD40 repeat protein